MGWWKGGEGRRKGMGERKEKLKGVLDEGVHIIEFPASQLLLTWKHPVVSLVSQRAVRVPLTISLTVTSLAQLTKSPAKSRKV